MRVYHCKNHTALLHIPPTFAATLKAEAIYRYITIFLMLGVFFMQTFSHAIIVAGYYANTTAYAKNCENKSKPWLHCNGKCQMKKQLAEDDKNSQETPGQKNEGKSELTLSSKSFFATVNVFTASAKHTYITPLCIGRSIGRTFDIFHPPQV